jgi:hypothetical protein
MPLSVDCCLVARSIPETPERVETEKKNQRRNSQERILLLDGDTTPVPNFRHLERRGLKRGAKFQVGEQWAVQRITKAACRKLNGSGGLSRGFDRHNQDGPEKTNAILFDLPKCRHGPDNQQSESGESAKANMHGFVEVGGTCCLSDFVGRSPPSLGPVG